MNNRCLFFLCPAQNDLSVPLLEEDLDGSSGLLFPFYDSDTHMLYVVGKVSAFQVRNAGLSDSSPGVCCVRLKSKMLLKHVNLRIWADGMGPESAAASAHIFHCKLTMFTVERYTTEP